MFISSSWREGVTTYSFQRTLPIHLSISSFTFNVNGCLLPWKNHITYFIFIISGCRKWMLKIALYFFLDKKAGMGIFFRSAILVSTTWEVLKKGLLKLNSSRWNLTSTWRCIWTLKMFNHRAEEINLNETISIVFLHELGKKLFQLDVLLDEFICIFICTVTLKCLQSDWNWATCIRKPEEQVTFLKCGKHTHTHTHLKHYDIKLNIINYELSPNAITICN